MFTSAVPVVFIQFGSHFGDFCFANTSYTLLEISFYFFQVFKPLC